MHATHFAGTALLALVALPAVHAQESDPHPPARFQPPVRLMAGDGFLGAKRLYPSPALHDVNGDGRADVVIADLPGRPTVAYALADERLTFGPEEPLLATDGEKLDFNNW